MKHSAVCPAPAIDRRRRPRIPRARSGVTRRLAPRSPFALLLLLAGVLCGPPAPTIGGEDIPAGHAHPVILGEVTAIVDGDTFHLKSASGTKIVDLAGVDAPERAQPFGITAAQVLHLLLYRKQVEVLVVGETVGRTIRGIVYLDGCVNTRLVREGIAWHNARSCPSQTLRLAQAEAQIASSGLWSQDSPVAPWVWREEHGELPETIAAGPPRQTAASSPRTLPPAAVLESKNPAAEDLSRLFSASSPTGPAGTSAGTAPPAAPPAPIGPYWLTEGSKVRHKPSCRYYGKSKGRPCTASEGRPCKICGG